MGNRVIIGGSAEHARMGIYLHWNGGKASIVNFVEYARKCGIRSLNWDDSYGAARLAQIIGNFFEGTLSVGVVDVEYYKQHPEQADDNGVFLLGGKSGWDFVRCYDPRQRRWIDNPKMPDITPEFMYYLNKQQPAHVQEMFAGVCKD